MMTAMKKIMNSVSPVTKDEFKHTGIKNLKQRAKRTFPSQVTKKEQREH